MLTIKRLWGATAISTLALSFASDASAFIVYKVGAAADCPYNTIQEAVDAAAANPGEDLVWIAHDQLYTNQEIFIADQDVDITGGFDDCDDIDPASDFTTISGNGNGGAAVFTIRGASKVFLGNLQISNAHRDADASGGGIDFDGEGFVLTRDVGVSSNSAGYGGGINMKGEGAGARLELLNDSTFINNTASTSGGGIRLEGNARLFALSTNTLILLNHAPGGYGGGIEVLGPAMADIGSPGYLGGAVIQTNDAAYGGGVAVLGTEESRQHTVTARFFTTDGANPVQVSNNFASVEGGGIYLKSLGATFTGGADGSYARACAFDYRIDDNLAPDGAAAYADWDTNVALGEDFGSGILLNGSDTCGPEAPSDLGAVPCAPDTPCNQMRGNIAADANAVPTGGAVILVGNAGLFSANRLDLRDSEAGTLFTGYEGGFFGSTIDLNNCVIADNHTQHELVHLVDGTLHVYNCTVSHDAIDNGYLFYAEDGESTVIRIIDDILDESGILTLDYTGDPSRVTVRDVLSNDVSTLPSASDIVAGTPTFVDAASGDYHLQSASLGVDFAPAGTGVDLDGHARTVDIPGVPNVFGALDLGAYEISLACTNADTIFCDGFDDGAAAASP
jgi:predicted outer membrane repeat protein